MVDLFKIMPSPINRVCYKVLEWAQYEYADDDTRRTVVAPELADVISSRVHGTDLHYPVLDLDVKHTLVPSTTPGHSHLYIDTPVTWRTYKKMLKAMAKAGVLEPGYVKASIARKHTAVRLPWIKKDINTHDSL